jgi:hypothetical protein
MLTGRGRGDGSMVQLYRWFQEHTGLFRRTTWEHGGSHTMRREVTVAREERTLLVLQGLDVCPHCGRKLPRTAEGNKGNDDDVHIDSL